MIRLQALSRHLWAPVVLIASACAVSPAGAVDTFVRYEASASLSRPAQVSVDDHVLAPKTESDVAKALDHQLVQAQVGGSNGGAAASATPLLGGAASASVWLSMPEPQDIFHLSLVQATAAITWIFGLEGGQLGDVVPINLRALGSAATLNNAAGAHYFFAFSESDPSTNTAKTFVHEEGSSPIPSWSNGQSSFVTDMDVALTVGHTFTIQMIASASSDLSNFAISQGNTVTSTSAYVSVDPILTILGDNADRYHFVGLPDSAIGSATQVPEPSSWYLTFGLLPVPWTPT